VIVAGERYSARGKDVDEILKDFEDHLLDATYGGNTTEYLHAAVTAAIARKQDTKAKAALAVAAASGVLSVIALVVSLVR
jgi:signal recognition particle GTPase